VRQRPPERDRSPSGPAPARRGPGELEAEILATLWATPEALTAGEVAPRLATELSYSTVVTIMSRLHAKGVLDREQRGRAYAYRPVSDEPGLAARRMRQVLDTEENRQQVLVRFVSELSDEDERLLRLLMNQRQGAAGQAADTEGRP
jgi:predicted transcriptional regulator